MHGYTVVEPGAVIATHLAEMIAQARRRDPDPRSTKHLVDELKEASPAVVDELIPGVMKLAEVQQILQVLLREQVPSPPVRRHSRNAWRLRRAEQGPDPAHENRPRPPCRTLSTKYRDASKIACTW